MTSTNQGSATNRSNGALPPKSSPFDDIEALRQSNKAAFGGEKEGPVVVTLGKPKKEIYVTFHNDDAFILPAYVWSETDDSRVMYYIANHLWDLEDLQGGLRAVILVPWLGSDGSLGIWAVPGSRHDSGQEVLSVGRKGWVRMQTDANERRYRHFLPEKPVPHRDWPDLGFGDMLKRAFGSRVVDSEDHELIRKLRNA